MEDKRFYVYVHCRADDGSPFYYGKGTGNRAKTLLDYFRSEWHRRVKEKHGCLVKILHSGLTNEEAKALEILLIREALARNERIVNITPGGDGIGSEQARVMGLITKTKRVGIFGRSNERIIKDAGEAGKIGGKLPWWYDPESGTTTRSEVQPKGFIPGRGGTIAQTNETQRNNKSGIHNPETRKSASKLGARANVSKNYLAGKGIFKTITCSCGKEMNPGNLVKHQKATDCVGVKL